MSKEEWARQVRRRGLRSFASLAAGVIVLIALLVWLGYRWFISDEPAVGWKRSALKVSEQCFDGHAWPRRGERDEECREWYRECVEEAPWYW